MSAEEHRLKMIPDLPDCKHKWDLSINSHCRSATSWVRKKKRDRDVRDNKQNRRAVYLGTEKKKGHVSRLSLKKLKTNKQKGTPRKRRKTASLPTSCTSWEERNPHNKHHTPPGEDFGKLTTYCKHHTSLFLKTTETVKIRAQRDTGRLNIIP